MIRSSFIAAIGVVALAGVASAQPQSSTKLIAGYVVSADANARTVEVKTGADTQTYTLKQDAKLESGKSALQAADLASATGQRVTIWYTLDGENRVASRVKVTESKDKAARAAVGGTTTTTTTPQ